MDGDAAQVRSARWMRMLCLVLLAATLLNYANRFAFTQNALAVQEAFETNQEGYGQVEGKFGLGFAVGLLVFGYLADMVSVRWLYPLVVVAWSVAGIYSGLATTLPGLELSRFFLGLFEAGHWPCALLATQRVFPPGRRTLANSILQSGASLGAVATPLLVLAFHAWDPSQWRMTFFVVGGLGIPWVLWWMAMVRDSDLKRPVIEPEQVLRGGEVELREIPFLWMFATRRWWLLLFVVICINTLWHYVRVWMPLTLEQDHGYSHEFVQYFTSVYYAATFVGSLASGWLSAALVRRGSEVHAARQRTFLVFGVLASLSLVAAFMPRGSLLLATLLLVAFGSLGLFPLYYSLTQELSAKNLGKVTGSLGFVTWAVLYFVHPEIGALVDEQPSIRPYLFAGVGLGPLLAYLAISLFWRRPSDSEPGGL